MNCRDLTPTQLAQYQLSIGDIVQRMLRRNNEREGITNAESSLFLQSYETLLRQLYGLPVQLPEFLVINGLRVNFIPLQQIGPSFWSKTKMRAFPEPNRKVYH